MVVPSQVIKGITAKSTPQQSPKPQTETPQETQGSTQETKQEKLNLDSTHSQPPRVRARLRDWKPQFLREFARCGIITMAARAVGVDRGAVLYHRTRSPKFEVEFQKALATANEVLEMHALKLATVGQDDPIFMRDKDNNPVKVFDRKRQSEKILQMLLSARMPEKYRQNITQELVGPGGIPLATPIIPTTVQIVIPSNGRNDPAHQLKDAQVEQLPEHQPDQNPS